MDSGFDEEAHEAQLAAMFLFETLLHAFAHLHDRCHVDLVEGGQDGVGRLRLQQTLGHTGTQTGHGHALLGAFAQVHAGCGHLRQGLGGHAGGNDGIGGLHATRHGRQHVALGHAAIFASAGHRSGCEVVVGHQLGGSRHGHACMAGTGRCRSRHRCSSCSGFSGSSRGSDRPRRRSGGGGIDTGDQFLGFDRGTVGGDDLHQHASRGCGHFQHHFVGFDVDQDLVDSNCFADFFLPLQQGGFRHGF